MNLEPVLCLVTSRSLVPPAQLPAFAALAAHAGVDLVHVRERDLPDRDLSDLVARVVAVTAGTGTRVVVNDRFDIAVAGGAAGVHLRSDSVAASRVRATVGPGVLIGRSIHSVAEAVAAERDGGCDYLVFGTVFASPSKPPGHPAAGIDMLRRTCESVRLPVLAIGGITAANAQEVAAAGAAGIAAITLWGRDETLPRTVAAVRRAWSGGSPYRRGPGDRGRAV